MTARVVAPLPTPGSDNGVWGGEMNTALGELQTVVNGLGAAADKAVGTAAGTVAAGDDARFTNPRSRRDIAVTAAGLVTENYNLELASGSFAPVQGTAYGFLVGLLAGDVVTNLCVGVSVVAAGAAPTLIRLALVDPTGVVVAVTANVAASSAWTTLGVAQIPLTAPYTIPATGGYRVVLLQVGAFATTQPALAKTVNIGVAQLSSPIGAGLRKLANYGTGLTDLPAVSSSLAAASTVTATFWVGCT